MDYYRLAAILVGIGILIWPLLARFRLQLKPTISASEITETDLDTVLHLANRLRKAGCQDGSELCQKLLDLMLKHGVR